MAWTEEWESDAESKTSDRWAKPAENTFRATPCDAEPEPMMTFYLLANTTIREMKTSNIQQLSNELTLPTNMVRSPKLAGRLLFRKGEAFSLSPANHQQRFPLLMVDGGWAQAWAKGKGPLKNILKAKGP